MGQKSESWRDSMFVWDGILRPNGDEKKDDDGGDGSGKPLKWDGTWVSSESSDAKKVEAPKRGAFADLVASDMQFHVSGTAVKVVLQEEESGEDNKTTLYQLSLTEGLGWDLADDDNDATKKTKYQDKVHDVLLPNLTWSGDLHNQLIFAKGMNDHGNFISAGWMRPGNRLTLARRYVDDTDIRVKWDLQTIRNTILEEIYDMEKDKIRIPPWQCTSMNSKLSGGGGQKRSHDEEEKEAGGGESEDKKVKADEE